MTQQEKMLCRVADTLAGNYTIRAANRAAELLNHRAHKSHEELIDDLIDVLEWYHDSLKRAARELSKLTKTKISTPTPKTISLVLGFQKYLLEEFLKGNLNNQE